MFENLTDRLSQTLRHVTGKAKLTEDNIKDTLREVRMALLEADVALPVVKDFVNAVKERAVGTEVSRSLTPGQAFVKIVQAELESLMGAANEDLILNEGDSIYFDSSLPHGMKALHDKRVKFLAVVLYP